MDAFKAQFDRIAAQLGQLSATQKMLATTLVVIMLMTVFGWSRFAGTSAMQPMIDQALDAEQIHKVTATLEGRGIAYEVRGDRVFVPADKVYAALADASYNNALPGDTTDGFERMVAKMSNFDDNTKTTAYFNRAKEISLESVISEMPRIKSAQVNLDNSSKRRVVGSLEPTCSVNVRMDDDGKGDREIVEAVGSYVAGAVAGLKHDKVNIVVGGKSWRLRDPNSSTFDGGDLLETQANREDYYRAKVLDQLSYHERDGSGEVLVNVSVAVKTTSSISEKISFDTIQSKPIEEETETRESTRPDVANEAGTVPNVGMSLDAGREMATDTTERSKTTMENFAGQTRENINNPAGPGLAEMATVRVPRSYYERQFLRLNPNVDKKIDEAGFMAFVQPLLDGVATDVQRCTSIANTDMISVSLYADAGEAMPAFNQPAIAGAAWTGMLSDHASKIALGLLAAVSLVMVSLMVRKAGPMALPPVIEHEPIDGAMTVEDYIAGEGDAMLVAQELNEADVESKQIVEQVASMVKADPDTAAHLMKRWMQR